MKLNSTSKSCSLRFLKGMRNFWMPPRFLSANGTTYSYMAREALSLSKEFELLVSMGS